ncbi:MAG: hypothetical protein ACE5D4_02490 [Thermodesulfobacteriota bacterium]
MIIVGVIFDSSAFAASKGYVSKLERSDLPFLIKQGGNDGSLFIYSSLSLLNLNNHSVSVRLSTKENKHLIPSGRIALYPGIQTEIKSEFFDFSIWGHLGNYFNKQVETIEIENDISAILQDIGSLNERYLRNAQNLGAYSFNTRYLKTISRENYFSERATRGNDEEENDHQLSGGMGQLQVKIQTNLSSPEETLKRKIVAMSVVVTGKFTKDISQEYDVDKVETLENSTGGPGLVDKILGIFVSLFHYLLTNKIEALIYITIIFLLINLIGLGLKRR